MSLAPWCCFPPQPVVPITGAFRASALVDTDYPPGAASVLGISQIVGIALGHVRLTLTTPLAQENANVQVTAMDTAGFICDWNWLDASTIDIYTFDAAGVAARTIASVLITFVNSVALTPLANPSQILGANLAVWLQGDKGTGAGPNVTTWVNQVTGNGDAVQGALPNPPVLSLGAFGLNPGVRFVAADAGLEIALTTPFAIGDRPYMIARAKINTLVHTPTRANTLFQAYKTPFVITDSQIELDAEATGTFDANAYWNMIAGAGGVETFITIEPPPDPDLSLLGTHTLQARTEQPNALTIDALTLDAPSAVPAIANAINRVRLNMSQFGDNPGFWSIGVFVMAYTTPTAPQIAALKAWCDAYGT